MWKHDNFINLQLYAPPMVTSMEITVDGETVLLEVTATDISWERNLEELGTWFTSPYSIVNNKVIWENGQTLQYGGADVLGTDILVKNGVYTTVNEGGGDMSRTLTFSGEGTVTINGTAVTSPANISTGDVIVAAATHAGPDRTPASASVTISYDGQTQLLTADEEQGIWSATQTYNITAGDIDIAFSSNSGEVSAIATINYTEKVSKTVDLTTLTGWANLSDGEHTITIKAKADGYRDSQASEGVSVTKGSTGETWVLNETLTTVGLQYWSGDINDVPEYTKLGMFVADFTSNNETFFGITTGEGTPEPLPPGSTYERKYVCSYSGWANTAYRTITFATAPTGDLLTWLQANGTKQGVTLIDFTIAGTAYQAEEGMTWEQWVNTSFNTDNIIIEGDTVQLQGAPVKKDTTTLVLSTDIIIKDFNYILGPHSG